MAGANIYHLRNVDYSERGQTLEIIVDGVPKPQTPLYVARRLDHPIRYLFYDNVAMKERKNKQHLLCVVLNKSNINVVWNLYWLESNAFPETVEIIYKSRSTKKR